MRTWVLLVLLLGGLPAQAEHQVSLGATTSSTVGFFRSTLQRYAVDATYTYAWAGWRWSGGLRWAFPQGRATVPLEVYGRAQLAARVGWWAPAVGPELGVSGLSVLDQGSINIPPDYRDAESGLFGPVYVAIHAAPLRFELPRFTVSALELQTGTSLPPLGPTLRWQLGLLHVGVRL
jgi:hypothetical protein